MKKAMNPWVTGLTAGAVIGTATYMLSGHSRSTQHTAKMLKRNTGKALKTVGGLMENMSYMMK